MSFEPKWRFDAVLILGSGLMISMACGMVLALALKHALPGLSAADERFCSFLISAVSFQAMVVILTHTFLKTHETTWGDFLGWKNPDLKRAILAAVVVAALALPIGLMLNTLSEAALTHLAGKPDVAPNMKVLEASVSLGQRIAFALSALLLAPLAEEILFRGVVYRGLLQTGWPRLALLGSALLFAVIHYSTTNFVPLVVLGVIWAKLYDKTGRLLASILAHSLFNAGNLAIYFLHPSFPDWLRKFTH